MAINTTTILNKIDRRLGIKNLPLPNISKEDKMEVIFEDSLFTFSSYFPYYMTTEMKLEKSKLKGEENIYLIDTEYFGDCDIVTVEEIMPPGEYGSYYMPGYYSPSYEVFGNSQMAADFDSMMSTPITFNFIAPNKLEIDEEIEMFDKIKIEFGLTHPRSFHTINVSYMDEFIELCIIDMKIFLYNALKHYDKIDSTFGQIDLKIEEWANAEEDRRNKIEYWKNNYIYARKKRIYQA